MPRPVHFEIHAQRPEAIAAFYESVFGWRFMPVPGMDYWLINTGDGDPLAGVPHTEPGIDGGMVARQGSPPAPGSSPNAWVCTVDVPDCTEYLAKAVAAGASVAMPVTVMTSIGWLAYFIDPDGNLVGLMQSDPTAG